VIETGAVKGRRITSWPALETDLKNAGARWVDEQVVVDGNMGSSRKPDDIPAFNDAMVTLFSTAMHHAAHSELVDRSLCAAQCRLVKRSLGGWARTLVGRRAASG
jgi:hypothetical protein